MHPTSTRASRALVALAAIAASAAAAGPALAADGGYTLQGVKGAGDTCTFTATLELAPGQASAQAQQTGFDPATCTITMKRVAGAAAADAAPASLQGVSGASQAAGAGAVAGATFRSAGYSQAWLQNVNGVEQNLVRNSVDFLYNGAHVGSATCGRPYFEWNTAFWLAPRYDGAGKCQYNGTFTKVTASSKANFVSPAGAYCSFTNSIWYNRHKTIGMRNGAIKDSVSFGGSSGCLSALFLRQQVVRTI